MAAEPAKIVDKPDALSVTAGDIAALEVKVCGTPELVPKWFKDGVELASGRKYKISFSRMISSLNVLSAEKVDSGEYTFEIMNEVGKDLSKINLTVLGWCSSYLYSRAAPLSFKFQILQVNCYQTKHRTMFSRSHKVRATKYFVGLGGKGFSKTAQLICLCVLHQQIKLFHQHSPGS